MNFYKKFLISITVIFAIFFNFNSIVNVLKGYIKNNEVIEVVKEEKRETVKTICQFNKDSKKDDANKIFGNIQDILKRGELVVCSIKSTNNPLFQMKKGDGDVVGEDIELAKRIAENLGVKLVYRLIYDTYDDVIDAISKGEGDIGIAKLSYTKDRSMKVLYTSPYVISRKTILINRLILEKIAPNSINDLFKNNKNTIAVTQDTSYEAYAKSLFPRANIVSFKDWDKDIISKVESGELIATMRDEVRVKLLLKENPKLLLKIIPIIIKNEQDSMSAVVNLKSIPLLLWINKLLSTGRKPATVDDLMIKYEEYIK